MSRFLRWLSRRAVEFFQLLRKITKQTFLHLEKKIKKKNVLFSRKYWLLKQFSRRIYKRWIFENAVCKGKGLFSTQQFNFVCYLNENQIYLIYFTKNNILFVLKWNQNTKLVSFSKLLTFTRVTPIVSSLRSLRSSPFNATYHSNSTFVATYYLQNTGENSIDRIFKSAHTIILKRYIQCPLSWNVERLILGATKSTNIINILVMNHVNFSKLRSSNITTCYITCYINCSVTFRNFKKNICTVSDVLYFTYFPTSLNYSNSFSLYVRNLSYSNEPELNRIFKTFVSKFINAYFFLYDIYRHDVTTLLIRASGKSPTTRSCRTRRWHRWTRLTCGRRFSHHSGTVASPHVRTTWTAPEEKRLKEDQEKQEEITILIFTNIINFITYRIFYFFLDRMCYLGTVLAYLNITQFHLFKNLKILLKTICSPTKHALSVIFVIINELKYKLQFFQNNIRPSLNHIKGTVFLIRNHMRPMNHYTFDQSVCGLTSLLVYPEYSHIENIYANRLIYLISLNMLNKISIRSLDNYINDKLVHDIEKNPGPVSGIITVITLNCRGLNQTTKFRLLLTKAATLQQLNPNTIIMLQETMIAESRYIDLAWRGKYIFTPGTGNSKGCITLLNNDTKVHNSHIIGNRGHYAQVELCNQKCVTLFNIYAPNGYNQEKRVFFENLFDLINLNHDDIILAGDFNLTLQSCDRHNRQTSAGERNIANYLTTELDQLGFADHLKGKKLMTWKKGNSMSKLDRIYTRLNNYTLTSITTEWTICDSDHAAVVATFRNNQRYKKGIKPCRLQNAVVNNAETLNELSTYLLEQLQSLSPEANPHNILEFAKMTIRTKAMQLGKRQFKIEEEHLKFINEDIKSHENLLLHTHDTDEQIEINLTIQSRINERNEILEKQGKRLAHSARSKWYNEGEKSNKYFLNLLKIRNTRNEMTSLKINGTDINDPEAIEQEVNNYYHELYNSSFKTEESNYLLNEMFDIDPEIGQTINKQITLAELWAALKPLKDTAPGPDGISHLYLKKLWHIIGPIILNAWNYSIQINKMPPSHYTSYLKLIPKAGKDSNQLKNWRPITLSNCDHKLITRIYNNRLLLCISDKIRNTQTAYIRTRNITDNIRMVNAAIQLARYEPQINGTVVALDAQKAFDTVDHSYIKKVLSRVGLHLFNPIFDLLYKGIYNDLLLNGEIKGRHFIGNGVKQGDALSCTLFLLAIEPLIRNVQKNINIKPIQSLTLSYEWPKIYGYADDITCVMSNDNKSKQALFNEYENFTKASGLHLNADKTEIFNFGNRANINYAVITNFNYMDKQYSVAPVPEIKMNGILLCQNYHRFREININALIDKMDRHFQQWSKRNLSLLGKVQIYKTFGLSQFLYHLSILEPSSNMWKQIDKRISKFLWNRNYTGNTAPYRIKKITMHTPTYKGGFGMIDIRQVVAALRLRRHLILIDYDVHPLHHLINCLVDTADYLSTNTEIDLDEVTCANLNVLRTKRLKDYESPEWQLEADLVLQTNLLSTKIKNIVRPRKLHSREYNLLRTSGMFTLRDVLGAHNAHINRLINISTPELKKVLTIMARENNAWAYYIPNNKVRDNRGRWLEIKLLTSKKLREIFFENNEIVKPKIAIMTEDQSLTFYNKISKLSSIPNKTKMLRLAHGDVYTAERRVRFGLTESDTCRRCFQKETIYHLLKECPYSLEVFKLIGIDITENTNENELLGVDLNSSAFEVRADLLISLVFRLQIIPPEVLVKVTFEKFAKGLANKQKIKCYAERQLQLMN